MPRPRPIKKTLGAVPYVLKSNRKDPESEQTKFLLQSLSGRKREAVRDLMYGSSERRQDVTTQHAEQVVNLKDNFISARLAVVHGLTGWDNFTELDEDTGVEKPIEWPGSAQKAFEDDLLDENVVMELGIELWNMSGLTGEEAGN